MIFNLVAAAMGGLLLHSAEMAIDTTFSGTNAQMVKYTTGTLGVLPFALSIFERTDDMPGRDRFVMAYLVAAVAFGLGVLLGHWADAVRKAA
jgi:hypothetical protein